MNRSVVISGCSGGGKSSLIAELGRRGYAVVDEPGRRVIGEELKSNGRAMPWLDMRAFLSRTLVMAYEDLGAVAASVESWSFFDRGVIDATVALHELMGRPLAGALAGSQRHYHRKVFLVPPWPEIYVQDAERRHDLVHAMKEYARLLAAYPAFGYETFVLPKVSVGERADYVLRILRSAW